MGSVQSDKLLVVDLSTLSFHLNKARKLALTDLAFEFGEVVVLCAPNDLLFDFNPDPLCKTVVMHSPARAIAFAGIEQEVIVLVDLVETYFAGIFVFRR